MRWIVTTDKDVVLVVLEMCFWGAADQFHSNTRLNLGRIFLRFDMRLRCRHPHDRRFVAEVRRDEIFSQWVCP